MNRGNEKLVMNCGVSDGCCEIVGGSIMRIDRIIDVTWLRQGYLARSSIV